MTLTPIVCLARGFLTPGERVRPLRGRFCCQRAQARVRRMRWRCRFVSPCRHLCIGMSLVLSTLSVGAFPTRQEPSPELPKPTGRPQHPLCPPYSTEVGTRCRGAQEPNAAVRRGNGTVLNAGSSPNATSAGSALFA